MSDEEAEIDNSVSDDVPVCVENRLKDDIKDSEVPADADSCAWGCHPKQLFTLTLKASLGSASQGSPNPAVPVDDPCQCLPAERPDSTHISQLPSELMILILQNIRYVDLCKYVTPVCKRFYQLAYDPILCTKISFKRKNISPPDACRILTRAPLLHSLDLNGHSSLALYSIPYVIQHCHFLRSLDLGFCDSVDAELLEVIQLGCRQLVDINVEGCDKVDDSCVDVLVKFDKLRSVNLSHCTHLMDESVSKLCEGVRCLEYLNIDGIPWVYLSGIQSLSLHCQSSLTSLDLDGANLEDRALELVCRCCRLRRLSLSFCELLTDACLPHVRNLSSLRELRLRKGSSYTSEGLLSLLSHSVPCSGLRYLDLTECTMLSDECVHALARNCTDLRQLSLEWCWHITDNGLAAIVDHCSKLSRLDLLGIHAITGVSLDRIPEYMPKLRFLDLQNCNEINDELVHDVIRRQPGLTVINYYGEDFTYWRDKYSL